MPRIIVFFCGALLLVQVLYASGSTPGNKAVPEESIPPYHWANDLIIRLVDAGMLDLDPTNRPFNRGQVAAALLNTTDSTTAKHPRYSELLGLLCNEFRQEMDILSADAEMDGWTGRAGAFLSVDGEAGGNNPDADWRAVSKLGVRIAPGFYAYHGACIDSHLAEDSTYTGKKWHDVGGYTEQGYFTLKLGRVNGWIGRNWVRWGPGRSGALLVSDFSRSLNGIYMSVDLSPFTYRWGAFELDRWASVTRFMSAHRVEWQPIDNLKLAASEMMLYSGENRSWELRYINPVSIWQFEQWGQLRGNVIWGMDAWWQLTRKFNAGLEFIVDDIQVDRKIPEDLEPPEIGGLLALVWNDPFEIIGSRWTFETVFVTQRTYKTKIPGESGLNYYRPIGWRQDNDVINWRFDWDHILSGKVLIGGFTEYTLKGEDRIIAPFDSSYEDYTVDVGFDEPFPTGTVARTLTVSPYLEWIYSINMNARFSLFYSNSQNTGNNAGAEKSDWGVKINGSFYIDSVRSFVKQIKHN